MVQSLTKKNSEKFSARILVISQFSTDCQFIESDKNVVAEALTRANVALVSDLPDALDFDAIAEAQQSAAAIQSLCNRITSLQIESIDPNIRQARCNLLKIYYSFKK